jgi:glycosyltransferase involved in cell wall biosynthesis
MRLDPEPFVSVVTPVYNTEKYLTECIESVLAQTYKNWEYIIVNNCSTDKSSKIAESYARKDNRIKIHHNQKFLNIIPNWNHALSQISRQSKYCKIVHADDWLFPECIGRMVKLAEANPSVGIVGSYRLDETVVNCNGLPNTQNVFSGKEICRRSLLDGDYFFGSPTTLLLRSDIIRTYKPFYNEEYVHADNEVCYRILRDHDFGFVHQILSYTRRHNETNTMFTRRMNTFVLEYLLILKHFGPIYLNEIEFPQRFKYILENYYRFLGRSLFKKRDKEFWRYHRRGLSRINHSLSTARLLWSAFIILYNKGLELLKIEI